MRKRRRRPLPRRRPCGFRLHDCRKGTQTLSAPLAVLVYFLYLVNFEFDPAKSAANLEKHGIDFIGSQALWSDPDRLEVPARSVDEPRTQVIGRIGDVLWSAFVTMRDDQIRIISVRRARDEEKAAYLQD